MAKRLSGWKRLVTNSTGVQPKFLGKEATSRSAHESERPASQDLHGGALVRKHLATTLILFSSMISAYAQAGKTGVMQMSNGIPTTPTPEDVRAVSPALEQYTQSRLLGDLWKRPDLSPRDRSIVTLAALIARNQTTQMAYYLNLALDNGVKPSEISEIITHLAFYSWENAMSAVVVAKEVF